MVIKEISIPVSSPRLTKVWHLNKTYHSRLRLGLSGFFLILASVVAGSLVFAESQEPSKELPKPTLKSIPPLFQEWTFDTDQVGRSPTNFSSVTVGKESHGQWLIQTDSSAPSSPQAVMQKTDCETSSCYQLLLADGTNVQYVDLSVRLKMVLGSRIGKGGVVLVSRMLKTSML